MLLVAAVLLVGVNSVKAAEKTIWTGSQNTNITVASSAIGSVSEGAVLRIYFTIDNQWSWQFGVCPNGHFKGSYFANWSGANWGDDNGWQDCNNGHNTLEDASSVGAGVKMIELEMTATGAEELSSGLLIKITSNVTVKKITVESSGSGYGVKVSTLGSGTISADKTEAEAGELITLTLTPDAGYQLQSVTATAGDNAVTLSGEGNTRTFTMPASKVTVTAVFVPIPSGVILWEGYFDTASWQRYYISDNIFSDINEGDTLCVFGFNTSSNWQFELRDGNDRQRLYMNTLNPVIIVNADMVNNLKTATNGNYAILFGQNFVVTAITLKAKAGETPTPKHTLTFSIDGQTTTQQVAEGADLNSLLSTPTKTGYTFTGWEGMPSDHLMPTTNLTLTAVFTVNSYTLTYKVDGETYGEVETIAYGTTITPREQPTRDGYTFSGWSGLPATMPANNVVVTGTFSKDTEYVTAPISSTTGYATFSSAKALDFTGITTVKAYYAREVANNEVRLTQIVGTVAAGTGMVIKGATTQIPVVESGTTYNDNKLVGVVTAAATVNAANRYVLVNKNGVAKFADTAGNTATVPVGKAYLEVAANSRELSVTFEDATTAISTVDSPTEQIKTVYNLRGQRVQTPQRGLYIVDGKKVMMK